MKQPFEPSPFARSLLRRMIRRRALGSDTTRSPRGLAFWPHWTDGLHPVFRAHAASVVAADRMRLHPHADALHSSMVFALNLFLPFRLGDSSGLGELLSERLDRRVHVDKVVFEYGGPGSILGEIAGDHPSEREKFTAADVGVFLRDDRGRKGLVLIEVKLSEGGFTPCGGAGSRRNDRREPCDSAARLFADPSACYLRRPAHAVRDRRYWTIFEQAHGSLRAAFPGCGDAGLVMQELLVRGGIWWTSRGGPSSPAMAGSATRACVARGKGAN